MKKKLMLDYMKFEILNEVHGIEFKDKLQYKNKYMILIINFNGYYQYIFKNNFKYRNKLFVLIDFSESIKINL